MITIYSLSHPISKEIFYVGRTSTDLKTRLLAHVTTCQKGFPVSTYIKDIITTHKQRPVIEPLEVVEIKEKKRAEEYWIQQMDAWGFNLLNVRHKRNKNYVTPKDRPKSNKVKLTEEELEIVNMLHNYMDYSILAGVMSISEEMVRILIKQNRRMRPEQRDVIISYYKQKARKIAQYYHRLVA